MACGPVDRHRGSDVSSLPHHRPPPRSRGRRRRAAATRAPPRRRHPRRPAPDRRRRARPAGRRHQPHGAARRARRPGDADVGGDGRDRAPGRRRRQHRVVRHHRRRQQHLRRLPAARWRRRGLRRSRPQQRHDVRPARHARAASGRLAAPDGPLAVRQQLPPRRVDRPRRRCCDATTARPTRCRAWSSSAPATSRSRTPGASSACRAPGSHHVTVDRPRGRPRPLLRVRRRRRGRTPRCGGCRCSASSCRCSPPSRSASPAAPSTSSPARLATGRAGIRRGDLASNPLAMHDLAAAELRLDGARAVLHDLVRTAHDRATRSEPLAPAFLARIYLANLHAADTAVEVTAVAHRLGGGAAAYADSPLLRALDDVQAVATALPVRPRAPHRPRAGARRRRGPLPAVHHVAGAAARRRARPGLNTARAVAAVRAATS